MVSITISRTITYDFPLLAIVWLLLATVIVICLCSVWRIYIVEKTKRIESEVDFKKAILKKTVDEKLTEMLRKELTTLRNKSWYSNWF